MNISKRDFLNLAPAAALAALPALPSAASSATGDDLLIALARELREADTLGLAAFDRGDEAEDLRQLERWRDIRRRIAETPAGGPEGCAVKARILQEYMARRLDEDSEAIATSLIADLESFGGAR